MTLLCEGKVAIVTGAARGIGREHALLFAKHGAKVVVNDLGGAVDGTGGDTTPAQEVAHEIEAMGGEAIVNGDDVGNFDGAKNMVDQAINHFGQLDILVNNAGILRDRMLVNMTEEEWDAVIHVHLKGTFAPTRHAAAYWRAMSKQNDAPVFGRVINTSSTSGIYGNVGQTNYGAAKAGIASFTIIAARTRPPRRNRQRDLAERLHPHDRLSAGIHRGRDRRTRPGLGLADGRLAGDVTGRVIQAGAGMVAVCEGWRRGAEVDAMADPVALGPKIREMCGQVRKNSGMDGMELD